MTLNWPFVKYRISGCRRPLLLSCTSSWPNCRWLYHFSRMGHKNFCYIHTSIQYKSQHRTWNGLHSASMETVAQNSPEDLDNRSLVLNVVKSTQNFAFFWHHQCTDTMDGGCFLALCSYCRNFPARRSRSCFNPEHYIIWLACPNIRLQLPR